MNIFQELVLTIIELAIVFRILSILDKNIKLISIKSIVSIFVLSGLTQASNYYKIENSFIIIYSIFFIMLLLYRKTVVETLFYFCISLLYLFITQIVFTLLLMLIFNNISYIFINGLIVNIFAAALTYLLEKYAPLIAKNKLFLLYKKYLFIILVNSMIVIFIFIYYWNKHFIFISENIIIIFIILLIWLLINFYLIIQKIKLKEQEKIINTHNKYMSEMKNLIDLIRIKQHDYKNHLNTIYGLLETKTDKTSVAKLKEYLYPLIETYKTFDKFLNIDDPVISAIIASKNQLAQSKGIEFSLLVKHYIPDYEIVQHQLVEIIGNLLDNAIEEIEKQKNHKEIKLILGIEKEKKFIQVINSGNTLDSKDLDKIFDKGYSTKKGKSLGMGLYNIKNIVDSQNGVIELSSGENYSSFKILFD